jgi:hypothetical protein
MMQEEQHESEQRPHLVFLRNDYVAQNIDRYAVGKEVGES